MGCDTSAAGKSKRDRGGSQMRLHLASELCGFWVAWSVILPLAIGSLSSGPFDQLLRSRRAFPTTETELKLIAAAAIIGFSNNPKNG